MKNYRFAQGLGWTFSPISTFFTLVSSRALTDAPHSRFRCKDPNQSLLNFLKMLLLALTQFYTRVWCAWVRHSLCFMCLGWIFLGWRFPTTSTFFSLVSSRAFADAPLSRFRCKDPNQCLPNFLKVLLLALPQTYSRVWCAWVGHSLCLICLGWIFLGWRFPSISTFFSLVSSRAFRDAP